MESTETKGVKIISLTELTESVTENDLGQKPVNGVAMSTYFADTLALIEKHKITPELGPIYVSDGGGLAVPGISVIPKLEELYGKESHKATIFRRGIANITFKEYSNEDSGSGLALNFFQGGMQMAYGQHIHICTNMSIYGGTRIQSLGTRGLPFKQMLAILDSWLYKIGDLRKQDLHVEKLLKERVLSNEEYKLVLGDLLLNAVSNAYIDSRIDYEILNITQVTSLTRKLAESKQELYTANDLLNFGTESIKPTTTNTKAVIDNLSSFGSYITKRFAPNHEFVELEEVF